MVFLSSLRRRPDAAIDTAAFPWTLPLVRDFDEVVFTTPVAFLVGENGSGKSTLLEGIAAGMDAVAAGSRDLRRDPSLQAARDFAAGCIFARRRHAKTRLFLRAEDVFGYTGRLAADMAELGAIEQELAQLPEGSGRDRATVTTRTRVRTARRFWRCCAPGWCRTASTRWTSRRPRCRRRVCWR
jgi:predicted ATPase